MKDYRLRIGMRFVQQGAALTDNILPSGLGALPRRTAVHQKSVAAFVDFGLPWSIDQCGYNLNEKSSALWPASLFLASPNLDWLDRSWETDC
jgi:hypothetical protein